MPELCAQAEVFRLTAKGAPEWQRF